MAAIGRDVAAAAYFHMGLNYLEILGLLATNRRIVIGLRTLNRSLRRQNLFRWRGYTDIFDLALFINEQIRGSGNQHGYRWMHLKCQQAGLVTSRNTVYTLMQILDPAGIELRKKGPSEKETVFCKRTQLPVARGLL